MTMKPQRDREQPAHRRIEAMKCPKAGEREPWPELGRLRIHGFASPAWRGFGYVARGPAAAKPAAANLDLAASSVRAGSRRDEGSGLAWLRIAIGIRRTVATLEAHLMRPVRRRP